MVERIQDYLMTGVKTVAADVIILLVYFLFLITFIPLTSFTSLNVTAIIIILGALLVRGYVFRTYFNWR